MNKKIATSIAVAIVTVLLLAYALPILVHSSVSIPQGVGDVIDRYMSQNGESPSEETLFFALYSQYIGLDTPSPQAKEAISYYCLKYVGNDSNEVGVLYLKYAVKYPCPIADSLVLVARNDHKALSDSEKRSNKIIIDKIEADASYLDGCSKNNIKLLRELL